MIKIPKLICFIFGHDIIQKVELKTARKALVHDICTRCEKDFITEYKKIQDGQYGNRWVVDGNTKLTIERRLYG